MFGRLIYRNGSFYGQVVILAFPIALQSMISIGVNMLDTIMVGRLGEATLSAVSLANQFISIYHILCMGIGMGASVLIARFWGMKEKAIKENDSEQTEKSSILLLKTMNIMFRLTVIIAAVFAVATWMMPELIMKMYGNETEVIRLGSVYFQYSLVTYFFLGLSLVAIIALRSVGQVKLPLLVSLGALFVNLMANYCLIFGKLGCPRMGIAGAALATLIARVYETIMIVGYLLLFDRRIGFRFKHCLMKTGNLVGEYVRISIPVLISDGILAIGNNAVAMVIGRLGMVFIAANAITAVTQQMSSVMIQGISQAGSIVTGKTLGFGEKQKAWDQGYAFLGLGLFLGILSSVFIFCISDSIIASYEITEETALVAKQLMQAIGVIVLFQATNSIMTKGVLRGGGDTKMLMLADNIFLWVLSIPLGILAGFVFKWPPFLIYFCLKFDQVVKAVWCVFRLRSGKWIKKLNI